MNSHQLSCIILRVSNQIIHTLDAVHMGRNVGCATEKCRSLLGVNGSTPIGLQVVSVKTMSCLISVSRVRSEKWHKDVPLAPLLQRKRTRREL